MKKAFQYIYAKLINYLERDNNYLNNRSVQNRLEQELIEKCTQGALLGEGSAFYKEAEVVNLQNNKSKISIGKRTHIRGELVLFANGGEIIVGNDSYIGKYSIIRSQTKIIIGNGVLISHNCNILDTDSHELNHLERVETYKNMLRHGHSSKKQNIKTKPIIIEDYAWLSFNVSILKGVTIGKGAIIAAGSVVTKDVAPFTIVAGNPAVFLKDILVTN